MLCTAVCILEAEWMKNGIDWIRIAFYFRCRTDKERYSSATSAVVMVVQFHRSVWRRHMSTFFHFHFILFYFIIPIYTYAAALTFRIVLCVLVFVIICNEIFFFRFIFFAASLIWTMGECIVSVYLSIYIWISIAFCVVINAFAQYSKCPFEFHAH